MSAHDPSPDSPMGNKKKNRGGSLEAGLGEQAPIGHGFSVTVELKEISPSGGDISAPITGVSFADSSFKRDGNILNNLFLPQAGTLRHSGRTPHSIQS